MPSPASATIDLHPRRPAPISPSRRAHERALFKHYHATGDVHAREELISRFLPLARHVARRYRRGQDSFDDLLQVASIGLIKAIDRYDPGYGTTFSSFAVPSISGEIKRHFRDTQWTARVPRPVQERVLKLNSTIERLTNSTGRAPTQRELATEMDENLETIVEAMQAATAYDSLSLDAPLGGTDGEAATYADTVGDVDPRYEMIEYQGAIGRALHALPARDRLVLFLRFEHDQTQAEIAAQIGVSQMHVSRILRRALTRLRTVADCQSA
jgi:RNA polymerase sigma-B factor